MKRFFAILVSALILFGMVACSGGEESSVPDSTASDTESVTDEVSKSNSDVSTENESDSEGESDESAGGDVSDVIDPAFIEVPDISHEAGEEVDLTEGITVRDNTTADAALVIEVSDLGGYDKDTAGSYTVIISATDEAGNIATAERKVTVTEKKEMVNAEKLVIGENGIEYSLNPEGALAYTTSGTAFRKDDVIAVLEKDFFISEYNAHYAEHTNNGKVPYFPNGVLVVTDKDMNVVHVRIAAGETIEIDENGVAKNSSLDWTNAIDASAGGGMLKGFIDDIDSIVPDGGYILIVGNPGDANCRKFLIKGLFYSDYELGAVSIGNQNVDISNLKIELAD